MSIVRGSINGWECDQCGEIMYAVHCAPGVTPAFLRCKLTPDCLGTGHSLFYPRQVPPQDVIDAVRWEWFKPTEAERLKLAGALAYHVRQGGLVIRELTDDGRNALESGRRADG